MQFWQVLQDSPMVAWVLFAVLGLCVGSFLNVVIYRMPQMMIQEWRQASVDILKEQEDITEAQIKPIADSIAQDIPMTLSRPASRCPQCQHKIRWYENIPVVSWVLLKGRCSGCAEPISFRYPLVELITALLTVVVIYQFGVTVQGLSALVLVWTLIALTGIDFDTQLLPDRLTFPLAGLGLAVNSQSWFVSPSQSIWGLLLGFLVLWVVVQLFYLLTKKQGMGQGDFKLLAVLGAWMGPMMLPFIILFSSLLGAVVGVFLMRKHGESRPFAFGPYIAIAGMVALLYGQRIMDWYLGYAQL
ncbi:prepilin peptidase [Psychrobacter sp. I-STPA6b]|uniref:prepilin peptidase n=1 Tax=Psychrobacter sp. I-STPA6b TaxID=2585718 RepID=UPI001D0C4F09|nr:A24 family peptidase [Psychrobacter sp. I-STPA6b]